MAIKLLDIPQPVCTNEAYYKIFATHSEKIEWERHKNNKIKVPEIKIKGVKNENLHNN